MKHTFLFEPAAWDAAGEFIDADGVSRPSRGEAVIVHEAGQWISEGVMRIDATPPLELRNRCTVNPPGTGQSTTTWTAQSEEAGTLYGTFLFAQDAIVSVFSS